MALTGRPHSTLGSLSDIVLNSAVPREACPHGLAPTASTTAALALGDALAVCLMRLKAFTEKDFLRFHPGGSLGQRLRLDVREVMRTEELPFLPQDAVQVQALASLDRGDWARWCWLTSKATSAASLPTETCGAPSAVICCGRKNL